MKYRKKPVVVEAVQYLGPNCPEGCEKPKFELVNSDDNHYFYIRGDTPKLPKNWMSYKKHTEEPKTNGFNSWVKVLKTTTNESYYRELLPFAMYEVKSGLRKPIEIDDELFKDYASCEQWDYTSIVYPRLYIQTPEGRMQVSVGDWVITGVNGEKYPCKPDIFEKTYEKEEA